MREYLCLAIIIGSGWLGFDELRLTKLFGPSIQLVEYHILSSSLTTYHRKKAAIYHCESVLNVKNVIINSKCNICHISAVLEGHL